MSNIPVDPVQLQQLLSQMPRQLLAGPPDLEAWRAQVKQAELTAMRQEMAATPGPQLPPVPEGHVRLWRGEGKPFEAGGTPEWITANRGRWFTDDPAYAHRYSSVEGGVHWVDVPTEQANAFNVQANIARAQGGHAEVVNEFALPADRATAARENFLSHGDAQQLLESERRQAAYRAAQPATTELETAQSGLRKLGMAQEAAPAAASEAGSLAASEAAPTVGRLGQMLGLGRLSTTEALAGALGRASPGLMVASLGPQVINRLPINRQQKDLFGNITAGAGFGATGFALGPEVGIPATIAGAAVGGLKDLLGY